MPIKRKVFIFSSYNLNNIKMLSGNPTLATVHSPSNIIHVKTPLNATMDAQTFKCYYPAVHPMPSQLLQVGHQQKDHKGYSQSFSNSNLPVYNPLITSSHTEGVSKKIENVTEKNEIVGQNLNKKKSFIPKAENKRHSKEVDGVQVSPSRKKISQQIKIRVITKESGAEKLNQLKKAIEAPEKQSLERSKTNRSHNKYRVSEAPLKNNAFESEVERTYQNLGRSKGKINTIFATENLTESFGPTSKKVLPSRLTINNEPLKPKSRQKMNLSVTPGKVKKSENSSSKLKQQEKSSKPSFIPSKKSVNRFHILGMIGSSKFTQAFKCFDKKTNSLYCLKKIKKTLINDPNLLNQFIRKIGLQFRSVHPNIIQIYDVFCDSQFVYLVEEYMEGGSLRDFLNRDKSKNALKPIDEMKNESNIVEKLFNINSALCYIHNIQKAPQSKSEPRIHGDLRPETILMNFGSCKISPINPIKIEKTLSLVHPYICPEALVEHSLTAKSDMWNLGLILYQLCSKKSLFKVRQFEHQMPLTDQIVNMEYDKEISNLEFITHALKDLIRNLLKIRPDERLSSSDVLSSPVIKIYGIRSQQTQAKRNRNQQSEMQHFRREIKAHDNTFPKYLYNPPKHNLFFPRKSQEQVQ